MASLLFLEGFFPPEAKREAKATTLKWGNLSYVD